MKEIVQKITLGSGLSEKVNIDSVNVEESRI